MDHLSDGGLVHQNGLEDLSKGGEIFLCHGPVESIRLTGREQAFVRGHPFKLIRRDGHGQWNVKPFLFAKLPSSMSTC